MNTFWRLSPEALPTGELSFENSVLRGPVDLIAKLRPRHGVVLGDWDHVGRLGRVSALGVVTKVQPTGAEVDWREVDITLRPKPAGTPKWSKLPSFKFDKVVAERYMLPDLFAERFPDIDNLEFGGTTRPVGIDRRLPSTPTPGYVYLVSSPHGYKIGRSVNVKRRLRLFEVKLPFPIKVLHWAKFEDHVVAERNFHQMFGAKRLEGEWFDLSAADIAHIRTCGAAVSHDELRSFEDG